jgi:exodeoxyribonuclease-5
LPSFIDETQNHQDAQAWSAEAERIAHARKAVAWRRPSRHEDKISLAEACESELLAESMGAWQSDDDWAGAAGVQGGRERGIVLHKLMEEVLTGETLDDEPSLRERARVLIAEMGLKEARDAHAGLYSPELAACVARGFSLPEVAVLRSRLVPETPVYHVRESDAEASFLAGVADALAFDDDGRVEAVIDWKSDVNPGEKELFLYRDQVRDYLTAVNGKRGFIVFLSSGHVVSVA